MLRKMMLVHMYIEQTSNFLECAGVAGRQRYKNVWGAKGFDIMTAYSSTKVKYNYEKCSVLLLTLHIILKKGYSHAYHAHLKYFSMKELT